MKKYIKMIIKSSMIFLLISCNSLINPINNEVYVYNKSINQIANDTIISSTNLIIGKIYVNNNETFVKENRLNIILDYRVSTLLGDRIGKVFLKSMIKYNKEDNKLYLENLQIDKILDEDNNVMADNNFTRIIANFVVSHIEKQPIYNFRNKEYLEKKVNNVVLRNNYIAIKLEEETK